MDRDDGVIDSSCTLARHVRGIPRGWVQIEGFDLRRQQDDGGCSAEEEDSDGSVARRGGSNCTRFENNRIASCRGTLKRHFNAKESEKVWIHVSIFRLKRITNHVHNKCDGKGVLPTCTAPPLLLRAVFPIAETPSTMSQPRNQQNIWRRYETSTYDPSPTSMKVHHNMSQFITPIQSPIPNVPKQERVLSLSLPRNDLSLSLYLYLSLPPPSLSMYIYIYISSWYLDASNRMIHRRPYLLQWVSFQEREDIIIHLKVERCSFNRLEMNAKYSTKKIEPDKHSC